MNSAERIEKILKYPQKWLMYPAGAGGEFLVEQIYTHSNTYFSRNFKATRTDLNQTLLSTCKFFTELQHILKSTDIENLDIVEFIDNQLNVYPDKESMISSAETYVKSPNNGNIKLFKSHGVKHDFFKDKTFYVLPDIKWMKYSKILELIKQQSNINEVKLFFTNYKIQNPDKITIDIEQTIEKLIDYLTKNNVKKFPDFYLRLVIYSPKLIQKEIERSFSSSLNDIVNKLPLMQVDSLMYNINYFKKTILNDNIIDYRRYFEKGYLEKFFDIDNDNFHTNMLAWHEKNLIVMKQQEFNVNEFIL